MTLNVKVWGAPSAPAVVLLHGITANAGAWVHVGPALADMGLRVYAPELRGHGDSPADGDFGTSALLDDLAAVVPTNPALLIGHSFGGYLAQAGMLAGRFTPGAVILEDPVSHQPDGDLPAAMLAADEAGIARSVNGILADNPKWSRLEAAWKVLSLEQVNWAGARAAFAGNAPWDLRDDAARIQALAPTIWVLPGESRFVPAADVAALEQLVGADNIVVAPHAGHSIHRDEPELFIAVVANLLRKTGIR